MNNRTPGKDAMGQEDLNIFIHLNQKEENNIFI